MAEAWKKFRRDKLALTALAAILILTATAILAPWLAPFDPAQQFFDGLTIEGAPLPPGAKYLLGTDLLGRDLLSRLIYGARTSLMIGVAANSRRWRSAPSSESSPVIFRARSASP